MQALKVVSLIVIFAGLVALVYGPYVLATKMHAAATLVRNSQ